MNQPIAGTAPATLREVTVMTVWPSIASTSLGRLLSRLFYSMDWGPEVYGARLSAGWVIALLLAPVSAVMYLHLRVPRLPFVFFGFVNPHCRHYRLTNRRVVVEHPFGGGEFKSVGLDRFDSISVEELPGQAWYNAGDLVFRNGPVETFRLEGVSRPEAFRQTCLKTSRSHRGVAAALALQATSAVAG